MADAKVFRMGGNQTLEDVAHALEDFLRTQKHLETEGVAQSPDITAVPGYTPLFSYPTPPFQNDPSFLLLNLSDKRENTLEAIIK